MKRDLAIVGTLALLLTAVGELAARADFFPAVRSDKGSEVTHAFQVLMELAMPVSAVVVAALIYSVLRYRRAGPPVEDGPPLMGRGGVPVAWFGVTAALAVLMMVYPGLTGLFKVMKDEPAPDLVVRVQSTRWAWIVSYPEQGVMSLKELVLPVDKRVRFEITSTDVIHSFWVPSFLLRVDAVPGMTTTLSLRPTSTGSYETDPNMRLQCSQMCGRDHATMSMPVRVVSAQEFDDWLRAQGKGFAGLADPGTAVPAAHHGH